MHNKREPIQGDQVIVNNLSAEAKGLLWRGMQALDPAQAALLQSDDFKALRAALDRQAREAGPIPPWYEASVTVSIKDYRRFVKWAMENPPATPGQAAA